VAGAPEDPREDVGFPVDHVGVGVAAGGDQPDVLRHRRMRRTGPLAIDYLVEVVGVANLGGTHAALLAAGADDRAWPESSPIRARCHACRVDCPHGGLLWGYGSPALRRIARMAGSYRMPHSRAGNR